MILIIQNITVLNTITLNTQEVKDYEVITKAFVDHFHLEKEKTRREVGLDFYDESSSLVKNNQDNDFNVNKLTNLDSITTYNDPTTDNDLAIKIYVDDSIGGNTILQFDDSKDDYIEKSVVNDV